jgi:hypothetical protein
LHTPKSAFITHLGGHASFQDLTGRNIGVRISNQMKTEVQPQMFLDGNQIRAAAAGREGLSHLIKFIDKQIAKGHLSKTRIVKSESHEPQLLMHRSDDAMVSCVDENRAQEFLTLIETQWAEIKSKLQSTQEFSVEHLKPDVNIRMNFRPNDEFRGVAKIAFETAALLLGSHFVLRVEFDPTRDYIKGDVRLPEPPAGDIAVDTRFVSRLGEEFQIGFTKQHRVLLYCSPPALIAFVLLYGTHAYSVQLAQLPQEQQFLRAYEFSFSKAGHGEIDKTEFTIRLLQRFPEKLGVDLDRVDELVQNLRSQRRG